jgi:Tol biopolymer transport system component
MEQISHRHPVFLPDGSHFLFVAVSKKPENSAIYAGSLDSKAPKRLAANDVKPGFASDHLLFMRESTLMAQPFDSRKLESFGEPFPIADGVAKNPANSLAGFTSSTTGVLAYRPEISTAAAASHLRWVDRNGKQIGEELGLDRYQNPALSPDPNRLAVFKSEGFVGNIWILDLLRGNPSKLTFHAGINNSPLWSPDGSKIVFTSNRNGPGFDLYIKNAGGGVETPLLTSNRVKIPVDWSDDGRLILYTNLGETGGFDLWTLPISSDGKPGQAEPLLNTPYTEIQGQFSPDGKWIAYVSDEGGTNNVWIESVPVSGTKFPISTAGGYQPRWGRDGKELYFVSFKKEMMAVDINVKDGAINQGVPRRLFSTDFDSPFTQRNNYDVTPDGQRFLLNTPSAFSTTSVTVVVNWLAPDAVANPKRAGY